MFETVGIMGFANCIALALYLLLSKKYADFPGMRILGVFLFLLSVKFGRLWGMPYLDSVSHDLAYVYRRSAISCILLLGPCAYLLWLSIKTSERSPSFWHFAPVLPGVVLIFYASSEAFNHYRICLLANIVLMCYMSWIGIEGFVHRKRVRKYFYHLIFALFSLGLSAVYACFQSARYGIAFLFGLMLYALIFYVLTEALPRRQSARRILSSSDDLLKERITLLFNEQKVYRDEEVTLPKVSDMLRVPLHDVSRVVNQAFGMSFTELVNQYRIEDAKQFLLKEDGGDKILAIAVECGYKSIATFNRVFKKYTNMTPSQFRERRIEVVQRALN